VIDIERITRTIQRLEHDCVEGKALCGECRGSGEGDHDGSVCRHCKGEGVVDCWCGGQDE
jgi:DnaJ-class molecular chaperone